MKRLLRVKDICMGYALCQIVVFCVGQTSFENLCVNLAVFLTYLIIDLEIDIQNIIEELRENRSCNTTEPSNPQIREMLEHEREANDGNNAGQGK